MMELMGYKVKEHVYQGTENDLFRATREKDNRDVIIKLKKRNHPIFSPKIASKEFRMMRSLDIAGVPKPLELLENLDGEALIFKDLLGEPIEKAISDENLSLDQFLRVAIDLTRIIGRLHQKKIFHGSIQLQNLWVNMALNQLWVLDFSTALRFDQARQSIFQPRLTGSLLNYISPEQTDLVNRLVDYRTDFYSMGIVFFQMLTNSLPFDDSDTTELIHSHLAKQPPALHLKTDHVPQMVSDIIAKLMKKDPGDRYQTAEALDFDLKLCLSQLEEKGEIKKFQLGKKDFQSRKTVHTSLYGRDSVLKSSRQLFDNVLMGGKDILLISGMEGVGKTSVLEAIADECSRKSAFVISGRFDPFNRTRPYSAFVQAFNGLIHKILSKSQKFITAWKEKILEVMGPNCQSICEMIPDLEKIIGPQEKNTGIGTMEDRNRLAYLFAKFMAIFSQTRKPLVLLLDDLHYMDPASLFLIDYIIGHVNQSHFYMVGTIRDAGEGEHASLFFNSLEQWKKNKRARGIHLKQLSHDQVRLMLVEVLGEERDSLLEPLSRITHEKTAGNPLYINRFLASVLKEKLIYFDMDRDRWEVRKNALSEKPVADNLTDMISQQLKTLPSASKKILSFASCMGMTFDLSMLRHLLDKKEPDILKQLEPALKQKLVVADLHSEGIPDRQFHFVHQRIQQTCYAMLDEESRQNSHIRIGEKMLMDQRRVSKEKDFIYTILSHFNRGKEKLSTSGELKQIAELNYVAGKRAMASAAYVLSLKYLETGIKLLGADGWEKHYRLTMNIHETAMRAAYFSQQMERVGALFFEVKRYAKETFEQIEAYLTHYQALIAQNRVQEALNTVFEIFNLLGDPIDLALEWDDIQKAVEDAWNDLSAVNFSDIAGATQANTSIERGKLSVLAAISGGLLFWDSKFFFLIAIKLARLAVRCGDSPYSAINYAYFSILIIQMQGDIDNGYSIAGLALKYLEQPDTRIFESKVLLTIALGVLHWKEPLRDTLDLLMKGYRSGLDNGDLESATYSITHHNWHAFFVGEPLDITEKRVVESTVELFRLGQQATLVFQQILHQGILRLQTNASTLSGSELIDDLIDEETLLSRHREKRNSIAVFYFYLMELMLCFFFKKYARALGFALKARRYLPGTLPLPSLYIFNFFDSLTRLAGYSDFSVDDQPDHLAKVADNQTQLKVWMAYSTQNIEHKFHLVEAERARVNGQEREAIDHYNRAIALSRQNGYPVDEALGHELAAAFWEEMDAQEFAWLSVKQAHTIYKSLKFRGKAEHLEGKYPLLSTGEKVDAWGGGRHRMKSPPLVAR